jgi:hypothetical protein
LAAAGTLAERATAVVGGGAATAANGSLNEYYHPDTGAALSVDGFMDYGLEPPRAGNDVNRFSPRAPSIDDALPRLAMVRRYDQFRT